MEELQRELMQSPDIGKLAEALSKAQSRMEGAKKDGNNPFFKSDYSTLFSVWQACRGPLTENSLSVTQTMGGNGTGLVTVYTTLMHSSGQWVKSALSIIPGKAGPQELGSCITYLRRYALAAMVGLSPLDDDGEAAMKETRKEAAKKTPTKAAESKQAAKDATKWMSAWLAEASKLKTQLGDETYYQVLKEFDLDHANQVQIRDKAKDIFTALTVALEDKEVRDDKNTATGETPGDEGSGFPPAEG